MRLRACVALLVLIATRALADGLTGRVVQDDSGAAVTSADVRVSRTGERYLSAELETGGDGRFQAPGLPAGDYRVEVSRSGYTSATLSLTIESGGPARLIVRLVRSGVIAGTVTSAAGQPVMGAYVQALAKDASGVLRPLPPGQRGRSTNTDENGRYRLYSLTPGEYAVAVSYGASVTAVASTGNVPPVGGIGSGLGIYPNIARPEFFILAGGEEYRNIDFIIVPGALFNVSGKVELPAPKVSFWLTLTSVDQPSLGIAVVPAAEDGSFKLEGVPQGSYFLFAVGPVRGRGFMGASLGPAPMFARTRVDVAGEDISGRSIAPEKGRSAAVRLTPAPGSEAACPASATVTLASLEEWGAMFNQTAQVGREKDAYIEGLAPTMYQLRAAQLGNTCYQAGEALLDLTSGDPGTVAIPVAAAGSIRGRLLGGKPGEFVLVLIDSLASGSQQDLRVATPDREGWFDFPGLPPGPYRIAARRVSEDPRARWVTERARMVEIEVRGGAPTDLELPAPAAEANP